MSQTRQPEYLAFLCPLTIEAASEPEKNPPRFRMIAYSGGTMRIEGFPHPVVVDLEGLAIERQDIPVRLDHSPRQGVGHTQRVAVENGQVIAEGLVSRDTSWARDVPRAVENSLAARGLALKEVQIDIGVQKRLGKDVDGEIVPLLTLVEQIDAYLRQRPLQAVQGAPWLKSTNDPIYASEHLANDRVFTSVLTVSYRVMV